MRTAAEKAGVEQWVNNRGEVNTADYEVDGGTYIDHICDCEIVGTESPRAEFIAMANPANVIALVEALEKVQSRDVTQAAKDYHFDQQADRIAELDTELERERE
ncbi:ead/Ea22-like family protein, partial [Klebsiella pneumoniae]|nr:ead/Ea22-like family protein [Klebsiella pneumoniae]